jgi:hypothetical protein
LVLCRAVEAIPLVEEEAMDEMLSNLTSHVNFGDNFRPLRRAEEAWKRGPTVKMIW